MPSEPQVAVTDRLPLATEPRSSCAWLYSFSWPNEPFEAPIRSPATLGGGDWTRPPWAAAAPVLTCPDFDTPDGVMVIVCARPIRFEGQF